MTKLKTLHILSLAFFWLTIFVLLVSIFLDKLSDTSFNIIIILWIGAWITGRAYDVLSKKSAEEAIGSNAIGAQKKRGWTIILAVLVFIICGNILISEAASESTRLILTGVYVIGLGALFLFAYYFENESILFRWLMWICLYFSIPRGRKMAFAYFGLATFLGVFAILQGLGAIPHRNLPFRY